MNPYPKYKDSGEQWLGQIPEHWEMRKLGHFLTIFTDKGHPNAQLLSVTREQGVILRNKENKEENHNFVPDDLSGYKHLCKGDFVINKMKSWQGSYGVSKYDGIVSPAYFTCKLKGINPEFFSQAIRSRAYSSYFMKYSKGIRVDQWDLDPIALKFIPFALPPLAEQEAMVAYLDEQTGKIDAAIEREQKMIDLLEERKQIIIQQAVTKGLNPNAPMKDSGIEWIGKIPEGWEVKRMKHLIKFINGYAFDSGQFTIDGDVCVIRISNIVEGHIDYSSVVYYKVDRRLEPYKSQVGDLLIAMSGATTGKVGFDLIGGAYINQRVGAIRSNHQKWIYYWLNTPLFTEYINLFAMGSAQPNISSTGICNFKITCPSEEEQEKIVAYLDDKLSSINKAIAAKNRVISLLQERKQIIINEVVTGKIKVS